MRSPRLLDLLSESLHFVNIVFCLGPDKFKSVGVTQEIVEYSIGYKCQSGIGMYFGEILFLVLVVWILDIRNIQFGGKLLMIQGWLDVGVG